MISFIHCVRSWLTDAFKDKRAHTFGARGELSSEPTHTVDCANIVDMGFLIHILISFSPFWILNMYFITAD